MLVDISWTWLAVHRGNKLINKSSGHCQPFWINGNRLHWPWSSDDVCMAWWAVWSRSLTGWQAVDDLTDWNYGLVERRPCPSTSAWRHPKESAWSVPFAHEPWARAVPVGEFLGSRRPAGRVRSLAMFWCWRFPSYRGWRLLVPWRHLNAQGIRQLPVSLCP